MFHPHQLRALQAGRRRYVLRSDRRDLWPRHHIRHAARCNRRHRPHRLDGDFRRGSRRFVQASGGRGSHRRRSLGADRGKGRRPSGSHRRRFHRGRTGGRRGDGCRGGDGRRSHRRRGDFRRFGCGGGCGRGAFFRSGGAGRFGTDGATTCHCGQVHVGGGFHCVLRAGAAEPFLNGGGQTGADHA